MRDASYPAASDHNHQSALSLSVSGTVSSISNPGRCFFRKAEHRIPVATLTFRLSTRLPKPVALGIETS